MPFFPFIFFLFVSLSIVYIANIIVTFMYIDYACIYQILLNVIEVSFLFGLTLFFFYILLFRSVFFSPARTFFFLTKEIQSDYDDRVKENDFFVS